METDGIYSTVECKDKIKSHGPADELRLPSAAVARLAFTLSVSLVSSLQRNEIVQKVKHHAS
jgi:hypothetical protein